jgi:PHD/YefM family antitoxin component YafN of YafNO toxin-antitoxin module
MKTDFCFKSDSMVIHYRKLSFKQFQQNTKELTQQIKKTGHALILTVSGKPRFVVQDAESYQHMLDLIDRLECIEGIRRGLEAVKQGRVRAANEVFEEIRRKFKIPKKA